jgi:hypothetical protein
MVTGTRPKPDPGGDVRHPATGVRPRGRAARHRRLGARGSGIGEFANTSLPDERDAQ